MKARLYRAVAASLRDATANAADITKFEQALAVVRGRAR